MCVHVERQRHSGAGHGPPAVVSHLVLPRAWVDDAAGAVGGDRATLAQGAEPERWGLGFRVQGLGLRVQG